MRYSQRAEQKGRRHADPGPEVHPQLVDLEGGREEDEEVQAEVARRRGDGEAPGGDGTGSTLPERVEGDALYEADGGLSPQESDPAHHQPEKLFLVQLEHLVFPPPFPRFRSREEDKRAKDLGGGRGLSKALTLATTQQSARKARYTTGQRTAAEGKSRQ